LDLGTLSFDFELFDWNGAIAWGPEVFSAGIAFYCDRFGALLQQLQHLIRRLSVPMLFLKT